MSTSNSSSSSISSSSSSGWLDFSYRGIVWTVTKPLDTEVAAIGSNRLAQTLVVPFSTLVIDQVSLYLGRSLALNPTSGTSSSSSTNLYNLVVQVYAADENGLPTTTIGSPGMIPCSSVTGDGWLNVVLNIDTSVPASGMVSIVVYQDGGDEEDYITWYYSPVSNVNAQQVGPALFNANGGTSGYWNIQPSVVRAIRILDTVPLFDQSDQDIETNPGTPASVNVIPDTNGATVLSGGILDRTVVEDDSSGVANIALAYQPLVASFVFDDSGSMGWNDRSDQRHILVKDIVSQLQTTYTPGVYVDVVNFEGQVMYLASPTVAGVQPGILIEVPSTLPSTLGGIDAVTGAVLFAKNSDGTVPNLATDGLLGVGFDGLLPDHTYVISNIQIGSATVENGLGMIDPSNGNLVPGNWFSINSNGTSPVVIAMTTQADAVQGVKLTIPSNSHKVFKDLTSASLIANTDLVASATAGDVQIHVDNASALSVGGLLDLYDESNMNALLKIAAIDTSVAHNNTITFTGPLAYSFAVDTPVLRQVTSGGMDVKATYFTCSITDVTADYTGYAPIRFSLVTAKGGEIQWPIVPLLSNTGFIPLAYENESTNLYIQGRDASGNALPNGTEVVLVVGANVLFSTPAPVAAPVIALSVAPVAGTSTITIPLDQLGGVAIGDQVTFINVTGPLSSTSTVTQIDPTSGVITFFPPVSIDDNTQPITGVQFTAPSAAIINNGSSVLPVTISAVEVTPIFAGRELPGDLRTTYDPPQIPLFDGSSSSDQPMSNTYLNQWNQLDAYRLDNAFDLPLFQTVDDDTTSIAAIRILPITEDKIETNQEEAASLALFLNQAITQEQQVLYEAQQDAYNALVAANPPSQSSEISSDQLLPSPTPVQTVSPLSQQIQALDVSSSANWTITTPIYLSNGQATGIFTVFDSILTTDTSTTAQPYLLGYRSGGAIIGQKALLANTYQVTPLIITDDQNGNIQSVQQLPSMNVLFASQYHVFSNIETVVNYGDCCVKNPDTDETNCNAVSVPGTFAASGVSIVINYFVWDHALPLVSGTLRIGVFDTQRNQMEVASPFSNVPNVQSQNPCDVSANTLLYQRRTPPPMTSGSSSFSSHDHPSSYLETISLAPAAYLNGYSGIVEVPVVNGRASFTIPASDVVAQLQVVAELIFPTDADQSVVVKDSVWYMNPLSIQLNNFPMSLTSGYSQSPTELSATVMFLGMPVPDNTSVEFSGSTHTRYLSTTSSLDPTSPEYQSLQASVNSVSATNPAEGEQMQTVLDQQAASTMTWPPTPIVPSIAKTLSPNPNDPTGVATGVFIGPHGPVIDHTDAEGDVLGDEEAITASVTYGQYQATVTGKIDWLGTPTPLGSEDLFYFVTFVTPTGVFFGNPAIYADGWDSLYAYASLPASGSLLAGYEELLPSLLGQDPSTGLPVNNGVSATVGFNGSGSSSGYWQKTPPNGWISPYDDLTFAPFGWAISRPYNVVAVINNPQTNNQETISIDSTSVALYGGEAFLFVGCESQSGVPACYDFANYDGTGAVPTISPSFTAVEPLDAEFSILGGGSFSNLVRQAGVFTTIVVDVTFSGQPLPLVARLNNALDSNGKQVGMPTVAFNVWKVVPTLNSDATAILSTAIQEGTLGLSIYSAPVEIALTSTTLDHFHGCQVDVSTGNGQTTITYDISGNVIPTTHEHPVIDFIMQNPVPLTGAVIPNHIHALRSVAITVLDPVTDPLSTICVSANVSYDASRIPTERTMLFQDCASVSLGDLPSRDFYTIGLEAPSIYVVVEGVTPDYSGLSVQALVRHYSWGSFVPVTDGARIQFQCQLFGSSDKSTGQSPSIFALDSNGDPVAQSVGILVITATFTDPDGNVYQANADIAIVSDLQWTPVCNSLLTEPTTDSFYITQALQNTATFGGSPLHDAVYLAATRLLGWQNEDVTRQGFFKIIFVLTDGHENSSIRSIIQAVTAVNQINGLGQVAVVPIVFGQANAACQLLAAYYANATSGTQLYFGGNDYADLTSVINAIFANQLTPVNTGSYTNIFDLGASKMIESATTSLVVPTGASVGLQFRFGNDGYNWGAWTTEQWLDSNQTISFGAPDMSLVQRYIQYKIDFVGTARFVSPEFFNLTVGYVEPKTHYLFFQPIYVDVADSEFVSEALIHHKIEGGDFSTIEYGFAQNNTIVPGDFYNQAQPLATSAYRQILLTRANETLYSSDGRSFYMINGSWPSVAEVEVYAFVNGSSIGQLVNPSAYSVNPALGLITFNSVQPFATVYTATVIFDALLNILCQVTNYSSSSPDSVVLQSMSVQFNTTARLLASASGYDRRSIATILGFSSSSSLSSPSSV